MGVFDSLILVAQTPTPSTTGLAEAFGRSGAMAQVVLGLHSQRF